MSAPGTTLEAPAEKRLWGTPLKLKQAEERIKELEAQLLALGNGTPQTLMAETKTGMAFTRVVPEVGYPVRDVWPAPPGKEGWEKSGHQFIYQGTVQDGEWVHYETMDLHNNTGYDARNLFDKIMAMAGRAVGSEKSPTCEAQRRARLGDPVFRGGRQIAQYSFDKLPPFKAGNTIIEVRVRIYNKAEAGE